MNFGDPAGMSPESAMMQICLMPFLSQSIYTAAKLNLSDWLASGPLTCEALAAKVGAQPGSLLRLLRALASFGIYAEDEDGLFSETPLSETLRRGAATSIYDWLMFNNDLWRWQLLGAMPEVMVTGKNAYEHLFGKGDYAYFRERPELNDAFNLAMVSWSAAVHRAVVDRYDFGSAARIVDVGGGIGSLLASIMKLYPDARGTLFDQPHVVSEGRRHMSAAGVADRCDYVGGDFLGSVPRGGDVYIISSVLMSLTDEQAMKLLKNCRDAIAPGGRLLVIEPLLGGRNQPGFGKIMDVMMLVETHGRVRSEEAFRALFSAAGFELSRIIPTNAMAMCLLEGIPNEDTGALHDRTAIVP